MIIVEAPFRISFFGGGTDYEPFFNKHRGSVISASINRYCYAIIRPLPKFFDFHTQVKYTKTESVRKTEEIEHPLVRNCMQFTNTHNLSISYDADLPARSGLGTSSSFAVALLHGMYAMQGKYVGKKQLAKDAIHVERVLCAEHGGWQDQVCAAYGGFNRIDFDRSGFSVNPIIISNKKKKAIEDSILMFFTGITRISSAFAKGQIEALSSDKANAKLHKTLELVEEAERILTSGADISEFGQLLDYAWSLKRSLNDNISSDYIDTLYKKGKDAGAYGGKLLGAGGGGFLVFMADPQYHENIKSVFKDLIHVPVSFENEGSKIVHYTSYE